MDKNMTDSSDKLIKSEIKGRKVTYYLTTEEDLQNVKSNSLLGDIFSVLASSDRRWNHIGYFNKNHGNTVSTTDNRCSWCSVIRFYLGYDYFCLFLRLLPLSIIFHNYENQRLRHDKILDK